MKDPVALNLNMIVTIVDGGMGRYDTPWAWIRDS